MADATGSTLESVDILALMKLLPHRYPFLMIDRIVDIDGDLATVTLVQTFENPTHTPLNATYLFPLNEDAAVFAMTMEIGDEVVEAQIRRREQARREFEAARHPAQLGLSSPAPFNRRIHEMPDAEGASKSRGPPAL